MSNRSSLLSVTLFLVLIAAQPAQATLTNTLKQTGKNIAFNTPHYALAALPTLLTIKALTNTEQIKAYKQKKLGSEPASSQFQERIRSSFIKADLPEPDKYNLYKLPAGFATKWSTQHISSFAFDNDFYINQEYYSNLPIDQQEALLVLAGLNFKHHTRQILVGAACIIPLSIELISFTLRNMLFKNLWQEIESLMNPIDKFFAYSLALGFGFKFFSNFILIELYNDVYTKRILHEAISILGTNKSLKDYYNNLYIYTKQPLYLNRLEYLKKFD